MCTNNMRMLFSTLFTAEADSPASWAGDHDARDDTTSCTSVGRCFTTLLQLFKMAVKTSTFLPMVSRAAVTRSGSRIGLLASVQDGDDVFQELHAFRFENRGRDERVVGRSVCNVWVVLVLKLSNGQLHHGPVEGIATLGSETPRVCRRMTRCMNLTAEVLTPLFTVGDATRSRMRDFD